MVKKYGNFHQAAVMAKATSIKTKKITITHLKFDSQSVINFINTICYSWKLSFL